MTENKQINTEGMTASIGTKTVFVCYLNDILKIALVSDTEDKKKRYKVSYDKVRGIRK
jgi:hypothetical protein